MADLLSCPFEDGTNNFPDNITDCSDYLGYEQSCWCNFSLTVSACSDTLEDGYVDYINLAFCNYAS